MHFSSSLANSALHHIQDEDRFARLRQTRTMRGSALAHWRQAKLAIAGCGHLGSQFGIAAVRSGCSILACDKDVGSQSNLPTHAVEVGVPKPFTLARVCESIAPGRVETFFGDFRSIGIGKLAECDLIVDCSDDAALTRPLTEISNGLPIPLMRLALDGSGKQDVGRVQVSHGGGGHACQLCTYSVDDLTRHYRRTPCPGQAVPEGERDVAPTIAGSGIGMAIAGLGLLQAQRLIGGNDVELAWDREIVLDMTHMQILSAEIRRSPNCLSGHRRWELTRLSESAEHTTFHRLFELAQERMATTEVTLEPYGQPLCLAATCVPCGETQSAVGTFWSPPPKCRCGRAMTWRREFQLARLCPDHLAALDIEDRPIESLGMPATGAMIVARGGAGEALHLVLC